MDDPHYITAWRRITTGLLALLVMGTLLLGGTVAFEWNRRQNEQTQALVEQVGLQLKAAEQRLQRADKVAQRTLRLETRRLRLSILVEFCTVLRLQGQRVPRCRRASAEARSLIEVIREFRHRLRERTVTVPGPSETTTRTVTRTRPPPSPPPSPPPPRPPPDRGNSDQCPPKNPHC